MPATFTIDTRRRGSSVTSGGSGLRGPRDTYSVEVTATDPDGLSDTIAVAINVTDVGNEPQWTRWSS